MSAPRRLLEALERAERRYQGLTLQREDVADLVRHLRDLEEEADLGGCECDE